VQIVDAQGCTQISSASVNDSGTLALNLSTINPICGVVTGSAFANVTGGNTPFTYSWNTGTTTSSITGITQTECVHCTVTDHIGCQVNQSAVLVLGSPIMLNVTSNNASCIYTADGSASVLARGGTPPYTYSWSNGQTTATATGLSTGHWYVNVADQNGCIQWAEVYIGYNSVLPCAIQISGTVYNDYYGNCIDQAPDYGLQNVWVGCFPDGGYQWTNSGGNYNFILPPGTYSLAQTPPLYHSVICPTTSTNITLTAGQSSPFNNFFNKPDSVNDLTIATIPYRVPVAGYTQQIALFVGNLGAITANPDVVYMHSLSENFLYSNPSPTSYDPTTGRIEWNGPSLAANGINMITLAFNIPSSLPTGYILNNTDTVYPLVGDYDTFNNYESYIGNVVRSYDPNYIDVTPKGLNTPGYISATTDTTLQYVVHFQNTGDYQATNISLTIPIDANLDISTFNFIGGSVTPSGISADKNRLLTITFNNINLPDSFVSQLGSQGFAAFTFRQVRGLAPGTQIHESANIYFDYNAPVPTNTTLNTIAFPAGIREINASSSFTLYPNPTQDNVTLDLSSLDETRVEVRIYDMMGRMSIELPYTNIQASKTMSLSTAGLAAGVYTVEVSGNASHIQKLVKTDK
jgi:hypothetical protein